MPANHSCVLFGEEFLNCENNCYKHANPSDSGFNPYFTLSGLSFAKDSHDLNFLPGTWP